MIVTFKLLVLQQLYNISDEEFQKQVSRDSSTLNISNSWDSKLVTKKNNIEGRKLLWSGAVQKGVWIDWVFHVKWSHKPDGLVEVWKDGTRIVNKQGPSTYNDLLVSFFKVGSYEYT